MIFSLWVIYLGLRNFTGLAGDFVPVIDAASVQNWPTCVRVGRINLNVSEVQLQSSLLGGVVPFRHMESHTSSRETAGANECCHGASMQRTRVVCYSQCTMHGLLCFATFTNSNTYKFIVPEAYFHASTIGANPAVIACKMAKLFKFLY